MSYQLDKKQIDAIEASTEELYKVTRKGILGYLEVNLPTPSLWGNIWGSVYEYEGGLGTPANIIRADKEWGVEVNWCLYGTLVQFMCGEWCIRLHCESVGEGEEFDIPREAKERCTKKIPMDPCKNCYQYTIRVNPGIIKPEHCGTPYKLVATVQYLTACNAIPAPLTGFIEFPLIEFYEAKTREKK
jgi:hypothetical protein